MNRIKISAVSYANTYPFIYGLENSFIKEKIILKKEYPSRCAFSLAENMVDIALVPISMLPAMKFYEIISQYCIGTNNEARSVVLISNSPLNKISKIFLDYQSLTSVKLVKILAYFYWNINVNWIPAGEGFEKKIKNTGDGAVLIGDRCFTASKKFRYSYDLAGEWKKFTGLPFVFAVWASNKHLSNEFKDEFEAGLEYGINNFDKVVEYHSKNQLPKKFDLREYLSTNIDYNLDEKKIKAMDLFFKYLRKIPKL